MIIIFGLLLGLIIGSFLNVVVYRLPIMLQQQWYQKTPSINLLTPYSHCIFCKNILSILEKIPVVSYFFLRGRCRYCHIKISLRYPLLETVTALVSVIVIQHYTFTSQIIMALIFSWSLLTLLFMDLETFLLPDIITLPMLWLGIGCNLFGLFTDLPCAVIGAISGYLSLWFIAKLFERITGKIGMANGDFKLLAMLGAWMGWQPLLFIVLFASLLGILISVSSTFLRKQKYNSLIPFGPYLACTGWIFSLWEKQWLMIF